MSKINLHTKSGISHIIFTKDYKAEIPKLLGNKTIFIITDDNIDTIYHDKFSFGHVITFPAGETHKTLNTIYTITKKLIDSGANRDSFIIGIGGGIVTDIAGFVASTYMRGIPFGFIPTTLLGMVDASIGGKNGVNLDGIKNIVGNFNQPNWILIDTIWLNTLPKREFNAGMAEVLKYALIYDADMFDLIHNGKYDLLKLIKKSVQYKVQVVEKDEKEQNLRRTLNFGHTIGHAIEKYYQRRHYLHGEAVAFGMYYIANISYGRGLITFSELTRITHAMKSLGLRLPPKSIELPKLIDTIKYDKKSIGTEDSIMEILLDGIGHYQIVPMRYSEYTE